MRAAAHAKGGDAAGVCERQVVVGERAARLQGIVCVDLDQLDAVAVLGGDDRVGVAAVAHRERVDAVGPVEPVEFAAVEGRARCLQRAVFVHADELDGVVERGHRGVRAAPDGDRVDVQRVLKLVKAVLVVVRRAGREQPRRRVVDEYVARAGQRARGARERQLEAGGVSGKVGQAAGQGARAAVGQVVRAIAGPHRIGEFQRGGAVARRVRGGPCGSADVEVEHGRGRPGRVRHGLVEPDVYFDRAANAVHAVRRGGRDRQERRVPCVDGNVL